MLFPTIVIATILVASCILMSTGRLLHVNRAAVAMFCGVSAWIVYMLHSSDFLELMGYPDYKLIGQQQDFIAENVITKYITSACGVILFLIATNTIVEILNNNGVFDSLSRWLRTSHSKRFLWALSILTFAISANVDNMTTVVLMMTVMGKIVASHRQKVIYACVILVSALLGGSFTVIGDMTSLLLWVHEVVTPSAFAGGLILPVLASLVVFNLLMSTLLVGKVEVQSVINRFDGDDSTLNAFQKFAMLFVGIVGLWAIPTFHDITKLPPFLGALTVLALVWVVEGIFNFKRDGIVLFSQHKYIRNTEFIGMRLILYFLGMSLAVGALVECGSLHYVSDWLLEKVHDVYLYGVFMGVISGLLDNIPFVMVGLHLFEADDILGQANEFAVNGVYWQLLSFCSALGASMLYIGTLAGHSVADIEKIRPSWYFRNISWRVLIAWIVGMVVFYFTH